MTMPAGTYFIGDLCYVLNQPGEWDEFCDITISGNSCLSGEFAMKDGRRFATYGTAYGDGVYEDGRGNEYPVDAGLIGCIKLSDITETDAGSLLESGAIIKFDSEFATGSESDGTIYFGHVRIDTGYPDQSDEDENGY